MIKHCILISLIFALFPFSVSARTQLLIPVTTDTTRVTYYGTLEGYAYVGFQNSYAYTGTEPKRIVKLNRALLGTEETSFSTAVCNSDYICFATPEDGSMQSVWVSDGRTIRRLGEYAGGMSHIDYMIRIGDFLNVGVISGFMHGYFVYLIHLPTGKLAFEYHGSTIGTGHLNYGSVVGNIMPINYFWWTPYASSIEYGLFDMKRFRRYTIKPNTPGASLSGVLGVFNNKYYINEYGSQVPQAVIHVWDATKTSPTLATYASISMGPGGAPAPAQFAILGNHPVLALVYGSDIQFYDLYGAQPAAMLPSPVTVGSYVCGVPTPSSLDFFAKSGGKVRMWRFSASPPCSIRQIGPEFDSVSPEFNIGQTMIFMASTSADGWGIWRCDQGTTVTRVCKGFTAFGSYGLASIYSDPSAPTGRLLPIGKGRYYFVASDATHVQEPWVTDLTAAGTVKLKECDPSTTKSLSGNCKVIPDSDQFVFVARHPTSNHLEIWISDGSPRGTYSLDLVGKGFAVAGLLWAENDRVVFLASKFGAKGSLGVYAEKIHNAARDWVDYQ
ncbi:MAG: hypothetical protein ABFD69_17170 [Candidatus Sumerlaeia bacterium]